MTREELSQALGQIDTMYIEEVLHTRKKRPRWPFLAAACLVLVCLGTALVRAEPRDLPAEETLPMLSAQLLQEGMGFEGVMVYDVAELSQSNPWTPETQLETLPVYRNLAYTDGAGAPAWLSDREMLALAKETARKMNATITAKTWEPAQEGDRSYSLTAQTDRGTIRVSGNGWITAEFTAPWTLEAAQALAGCRVDASWTDYSFAGEPFPHREAWKGGEAQTEAILRYNFARATFAQDEAGKVWMMGWGDLLGSAEKLGDYGILSLEEARDLLLAGDCLTSVPEEYGGVTREAIGKEELVYVTGNANEVFQPYYKFWVELTDPPGEMAEGLKTYGAYYVPAVSPIYLTDFPSETTSVFQ
ncbi:MAG: hypothetical protein IKB65_05725 [Ruminiclostridium sp.]|nr:hypothetical protein [Ruminiclostridium sp.]